MLWAMTVALVALSACTNKATTTTPASETSTQPKLKGVVTFDADSAYAFIQTQVDMGPRVPGTEGSRKCARWIADKLRQYGADSIIEQSFKAKAHTGDTYNLTNVMGRFGAPNKPRVLLVAHYDTRPWADRDRNSENADKPIPGANDGASGVGVLLELARQLQVKRPDIAVDMLFVDGEDMGKSDGWTNTDSTWCLGTQYWTEHMPADYRMMPPAYGILLDMVGSPSARFMREFISERYAPSILDKVWQIAEASGYGNYFINKAGGSVIDDHLFINIGAGIPTIDIIDCNNAETGTFPAPWHTMADDMSGIDPSTLRAVGQTVSNVIYRERP